MSSLPPLSALPVFEATARLGSVSAASNELGRTSSAISKQLRRLADDLGSELFEKNGNGIKLTMAGESLYKRVSPILNELGVVASSMREEHPTSEIVVGVSVTLASRWMLQRLPRFYDNFTGIYVRILAIGFPRVGDQEIDIILSYDRLRGDLDTPNSVQLGDTEYGPVFQSTEQGRWGDDGGLQIDARLVQYGGQKAWTNWSHLSGCQVFADRTVEFPHHFLAIDAAIAGLGAAMTERRLVEQELADGALVAPCGFSRVLGGFRAMITLRGRESRYAGIFLDWLREEARGTSAS